MLVSFHPRDALTPGTVSGLRIGTAAVSARGLGIKEMAQIAQMIQRVLGDPENEDTQSRVQRKVLELYQTTQL